MDLKLEEQPLLRVFLGQNTPHFNALAGLF